MEEKESTISGSPVNSGSESPASGVMPQVLSMAVNMNMERSPGLTTSLGGGDGSFDLLGRKKRGRPRKYDSDGNLRLSYSTPPPPPPPGFSLTTAATPFSDFSAKRGRGRPPGSGNWQLLASLGELFANTAGGDFTPHIVTVNTGEDVVSKILSLSQKGPRGICILSANGAVSNVTIRQPGSAGGILTYEGRFEILSLSGSLTVTDTGGVRSRTGGLSVSLAGPDGRVIGGGVAGLLTAASPIQIVVGSFVPNGYKAHKRKHYREPSTPSIVPAAPLTAMAARSTSEAGPEVDTSQSHGEADTGMGNKQTLNTTHSQSAAWNGSETTSDQKPSPDINVSVPGA
ncbi:AT-hook motif nuclear-localized protein 1-like [Malania oleifera]|uniref:AT-hook motif nuclear-localized protein 1-like n=1 Tax=Malania oleifera TaxID=397392 RepID=UPI0025AE4726|nr:AT-hook motif nuclear-localized protein 1-like [Malania oleifera]